MQVSNQQNAFAHLLSKKGSLNTFCGFVCGGKFSIHFTQLPFFSPNTLMFSLQIGRFCDPSRHHQER